MCTVVFNQCRSYSEISFAKKSKIDTVYQFVSYVNTAASLVFAYQELHKKPELLVARVAPLAIGLLVEVPFMQKVISIINSTLKVVAKHLL